MTPTPGDITHRIGPSVPSPSLPARSYSISSISRLARTTSVLEYARSLQGRVYPLGYGL